MLTPSRSLLHVGTSIRRRNGTSSKQSLRSIVTFLQIRIPFLHQHMHPFSFIVADIHKSVHRTNSNKRMFQNFNSLSPSACRVFARPLQVRCTALSQGNVWLRFLETDQKGRITMKRLRYKKKKRRSEATTMRERVEQAKVESSSGDN